MPTFEAFALRAKSEEFPCIRIVVRSFSAQLLPVSSTDAPPKSQGHVTSAYFSAAAGRPIALALLANGRARHGEVIHATSNRGVVPVTVAPPIFVDPENHHLAL